MSGRKEKMEGERKAAREEGLLWLRLSISLGGALSTSEGALPGKEASIS